MTLALEVHEGVEAQADPQRLEPDYAVERDVAEVDIGTNSLDQFLLDRLAWRLEHEALDGNAAGQNVIEQVDPQLAVAAADAAPARFARFQDHVVGARCQILRDGLDPLRGGHGQRAV